MTSRSQQGRITFASPPVDETILSIQFAAIAGLQNHHVGLLWSRIRKAYPKVIEQMPLAPVFETYGTSPKHRMAPGILFEPITTPQMSRYWFEGDDPHD